MAPHILTEENCANRSIYPVDDLDLENNVSVLVVKGVERNAPAIGIVRIPKNAGVDVLNPKNLQSVRKGVVKVPHVE
jgi:hypothetical protein